MERKINRLVTYLMRGEISQEEFVNLVRKDLYRERQEDRRVKVRKK